MQTTVIEDNIQKHTVATNIYNRLHC